MLVHTGLKKCINLQYLFFQYRLVIKKELFYKKGFIVIYKSSMEEFF